MTLHLAIWGGVETKEVEIKKEYYNAQDLPNLGIIICRHVIEHIQEPLKFLQAIRNNINGNPIVFFETPRIEWILQNNAFYDFFYEHCNYFSELSMRILFQRADFEIIEIMPSFNNQYQLIFAKPQNMQTKINDSKILELNQFENIAIWGAGAKGVTLANILKNVKCVIDINPNKQNCFIPKSAIEILSPQDALNKYKLDVILVMNPNYINEIKNTIKDSKIKIDSV